MPPFCLPKIFIIAENSSLEIQPSLLTSNVLKAVLISSSVRFFKMASEMVIGVLEDRVLGFLLLDWGFRVVVWGSGTAEYLGFWVVFGTV